jgi:hypothetical protein
MKSADNLRFSHEQEKAETILRILVDGPEKSNENIIWLHNS